MKNNKSGINKYLVIISLVTTLLLGISYAYIALSDGGADIKGGITNTFDVELLTTNNGYIRANNILPILPEDIEEEAETTSFSVRTGDNPYSVNYKLLITELSISKNLQVPVFKWQLTCLEDETKNISGSFEGVDANQMVILDDIRLAPNSTDNYELKMWIEDDNTNQIELINGEFRGKITVISNMVYE